MLRAAIVNRSLHELRPQLPTSAILTDPERLRPPAAGPQKHEAEPSSTKSTFGAWPKPSSTATESRSRGVLLLLVSGDSFRDRLSEPGQDRCLDPSIAEEIRHSTRAKATGGFCDRSRDRVRAANADPGGMDI
jgi:hypothetical protein